MILSAIRNKKMISFMYSGELREVEPYLFGVTTAGNRALRAFQINKGWRIFEEAKISNLKELDHEFDIRPEYNPNDEGFSTFLGRI